jgi:hypothetical protein
MLDFLAFVREKGKETQNPFPLTFTLSPKSAKIIFARGLLFMPLRLNKGYRQSSAE